MATKIEYALMSAIPLLVLAGCGPDVARWKEEVLLHDGRMIVVERVAKRAPSGFPAGNRGRDLEFELRHDPLKVYWKDANGNQQAAFEIFDSIPYLVIFVGNEYVFCKGKPPATLPIRVLKMQGKEWIDIDPATFPVDQANYNLYRRYWGNKPSEDARGLITWKHKEDYDAYPIAAFENGFARRRPHKLRERFVDNGYTCARFQQN